MRKQILVVPQAAFLRNDTIFANIIYPREEPIMAEVEGVVQEAQLKEFVESLLNGYDEVVGQREWACPAASASESPSPALCIVRRGIVLLDEPTSALDALTELQLAGAIQRLRERSTLIVVANRLGTVIETYNVLGIEDGRIIESGTPGDLIRQVGLFAKMH